MDEDFKYKINPVVDYASKHIDLEDFFETEIGAKITKNNSKSGVMFCPFPDHGESKASFRVYYNEEEGAWSFYCWGCNRGGTIVNFYMYYYGLTFREALKKVCEKHNINEGSEDFVKNSLNINKKINFSKKMECAHIVSSNQCRNLLRKDYKKNSKWVAEMYKKMNDALSRKDIDFVEEVAFNASKRMVV